MRLGIVFPGQGSQSVGMLKELAGADAVVGETFAAASEALGYDLWQVVQEGPEERLNRTDVTQPAMLASGVAVWRAWRARGGAVPVALAGHSLGEYTALVCAGSLDFPAAVGLVAERGRLMQEAVPEGLGAMAAILGLDDAVVQAVCAESAQGQVACAVNFNSPGQVVVAGHRTAVDRAVALAKARGARRAVLLAVSVPAHSDLMQPAAERLAERLRAITIKAPQIPVINNVDVAAPSEPDAIRDALIRQVHSPVRWVESIQRMREMGVQRVIEMGPGKVLTGLIKRIDSDLPVDSVSDPAGLERALSA